MYPKSCLSQKTLYNNKIFLNPGKCSYTEIEGKHHRKETSRGAVHKLKKYLKLNCHVLPLASLTRSGFRNKNLEDKTNSY